MHWIFAHLIGDYILQNDWMAINKKNNSWICLLHVILYMIPFIFCNLLIWQLIIIAIEHFIQDRTNIVTWTMKIKGSEPFSKPPFAPWSIILMDNIYHILFIALIAKVNLI